MLLKDSTGELIAVDSDGFMLDPSEWTPEIAESIAHHLKIDPLCDKQWKVITLCREWFARERRRPDVPFLATLSGLRIDELQLLFGSEPLSRIARIAGLPNLSGLSGDRS